MPYAGDEHPAEGVDRALDLKVMGQDQPLGMNALTYATTTRMSTPSLGRLALDSSAAELGDPVPLQEGTHQIDAVC